MELSQLVESWIQTDEVLYEDVAAMVAYFGKNGVGDRSPIEEGESSNPQLRQKLETVIEALQKKHGITDTLFVASKRVNDRKISVFFGKQDGVWRCLDTSTIKSKGF